MSDRLCEDCHHSFDAHVLVALVEAVIHGKETPVGGWMHCPECDCRHTWSIPDVVAGFDVKARIPPWEDWIHDIR